MRSSRIAALASGLLLISASPAFAVVLHLHGRLRIADPVQAHIRIWSAPRGYITGSYRMHCGAFSTHRHFLARSGQSVTVLMPSDHLGRCVLTMNAQARGAHRLHARLSAVSTINE